MRNRLLFGALLIAALVVLLYVDARLGSSTLARPAAFLESAGMVAIDGIAVALIVLALSLLGLREAQGLFRAAGHPVPLAWLSISSSALVLVPFIAGNYDATYRGGLDARWTLGVFVAGFVGVAIALMARRRTAGAIAALGVATFALVYLGLLPAYIVRLRVFGGTAGLTLLIYYIVTVKICDIGAYFTGYTLGRHKLIEWLSPKKTIEGLAGGVAASIAFAVGATLAARQFAPASEWARALPAPAAAAAFGLCMALFGQLGDLLESLLKRDAGAKDSAQAIPAFGGVLDIIDSPLLTAPLACWLLLE